MTTTFDPVAFKATTRAQWESAASAWHEWGPSIEDWLGAATERMLDEAGVSTGTRVLDVAAGAGRTNPHRCAARRTGGPRPGHRHLARDPGLRRRDAGAAGLTQVATLEADGEALSRRRRRFLRRSDLTGRARLFPDRHRALTEILSDAEAGRARVVGPSTRRRIATGSSRSRWASSVAWQACRPRPRDFPGPFSMGTPGVAEALHAEAGSST